MQKLFSSFKTPVHRKLNMNSLELSYGKSNFLHWSILDYMSDHLKFLTGKYLIIHFPLILSLSNIITAITCPAS